MKEKVELRDIKYEDGCYSGLVVITDKEDEDGIHECISFLYDVEMDTLDIVNRLYPSYLAPIHNEMSDYVIQNYDYLIMMIKDECKYL